MRKKKGISQKGGFTLIEMMVVVAIIAVLTALAIPNVQRARITANDNAAQSYLRTVSAAFETYAMANNGCYPTASADLTGATPAYIDAASLTAGTHYGHTVPAITYATDCDDGNTYTISATEIANKSEQSWQIIQGGFLSRTD